MIPLELQELQDKLEKAYSELMHTDAAIMTLEVRDFENALSRTFDVAYSLGREHGDKRGEVKGIIKCIISTIILIVVFFIYKEFLAL